MLKIVVNRIEWFPFFIYLFNIYSYHLFILFTHNLIHKQTVHVDKKNINKAGKSENVLQRHNKIKTLINQRHEAVWKKVSLLFSCKILPYFSL